MNLRKFQESDLDQILKLFHDVVHTVGAKYYDAAQIKAWGSALDREKWLKSLSSNITYVVLDKGRIIAFGDMSHQGYIDHLFVHKKYQGSGAALKIFRKLEEEAKQLGLTELTTEASIMAMPLAERQGFEVLEKQTKVHRGLEFVNYIMRKKLI